MNQGELIKIIKAPHITEKSSGLGGLNQYAFKVAVGADKLSIAEAVGQLFKVQVAAVHTVRVPGKTRRFRGRAGRTSGWKKAYVTLAEGHTINFSDI